MTLRIAICDDEQADIQALKFHLDRYQILHDIELIIDCFATGQELLFAHERNEYQIIFLDIEMPHSSGMSIAKQLRIENNDDVIIIFVTSYPQYMKDSFNVQPFQFLTKPVDFTIIEEVISNIIRRYQNSHVTKILLGLNGEEHLIRISNILYIKSHKEKRPILEYVLTNRTIVATGTLRDWEESLSQYGFISPCRGYLVNVRHIHSFNQNRILLSNNTEIPISRRRTKLVHQTYANRILHIMN